MPSLRTAIAACLLVVGALAPAGCSEETGKDAEIVTIRPAQTTGTKQGLPIFQGISGQNAGAKHISMNKVIIPPGGQVAARSLMSRLSNTRFGAPRPATASMARPTASVLVVSAGSRNSSGNSGRATA